MKRTLKEYIGPGPLIAAAFIGPGTVTVCTIAGVSYGYELLWAIFFSVLITIVFQEMSSRIGLATQLGLANLLGQTIHNRLLRIFGIGLVILAIFLGNAAYEAGNIGGAALGAALLLDLPPIHASNFTINLYSLFIGLIALILLLLGSYQAIQKILTTLVILMSLTFLTAAIMTKPSFHDLFAGFSPTVNSRNIITVVALLGTTVVPYNLFLHSALVAKKWKSTSDLKLVRVDTMVSIALGGLISGAIVITAAGGTAMEVESAADLALGLEPTFGILAKYLISAGLLAAGVTSAMTAPLAGALVLTGCFGLSQDFRTLPMRLSMGFIVLLGLIFASLGMRPVQLITFAQLANGVLLPLIATYILVVINEKKLLGKLVNSPLQNLWGIACWLLTLLLGMGSLLKVMGIW
ncbi:Nramp family divalent metal transporter [Litoribacter alkaliphilus]|uniref:Nramp family divalent metal transporter n=1 Tax=Litoribacter ruber TaxID=702568 RepID=A0AAP2CJN9_9BACT|nr:Nramp family divalent metal transporter [Litoribacter alkaliphilus]MBS9524426.1 Nramp family divalent metal transporter [Litoribacter alkaliphilus]